MSTQMSVTRTRAQRLSDERAAIDKLHEDLLSAAENREPGEQELTEIEGKQIEQYRTRQVEIDKELDDLTEVMEREEKAADVSKKVRAHVVGNSGGAVVENGEVHYRTFAAYARDEIISRFPQVASRAGGEDARRAAKERLMRTPENTLTSDVGGLLPPTYIQQIMDVINKSRPVVDSSRSVPLGNGKLTWPKIAQRPVVDLQANEKTEAGNQKMTVTMQDTNASTYLGGGDLSWQVMNWATPDALQMWFDLASEDFAIKTEAAACAVVEAAASSAVTDTLAGGGTDTLEDILKAITEGLGAVYAATGNRKTANTLYLAPDMFFPLAAVASTSRASFIGQGQLDLGTMGGNLGGVQVVTSPGFSSGFAALGDSQALLTAETPGAPVELRAIEPAIGGMEVGIIGAFATVSFDDTRFISLVPVGP